LFAPDVAAVVLFCLVVLSVLCQFLYALAHYILHQLKALDLLHIVVSSDYGFIFAIMDYSYGFVHHA